MDTALKELIRITADIHNTKYPQTDHYFRSRNIWSAKGKTIPRRLHAIDSNFAKRFLDSFESIFSIFANNCPVKVIDMAVEILDANGGFLFEEYRLEAPKSWRIGQQ